MFTQACPACQGEGAIITDPCTHCEGQTLAACVLALSLLFFADHSPAQEDDLFERTLSKKGPHPLDEFRRVIDLNLVSTFNVARLAAAEGDGLTLAEA